MAVLSTEVDIDDGPVLLTRGNAGGHVLIFSEDEIAVGGPGSGAQLFPLTPNVYHEIHVGLGEELWADAESAATVYVLDNGA